MNLFWIKAPPHGFIVHGNLNFPNCAALDWPDFSNLLHGTLLVLNSDDCTHFGSPVCIFFGGGVCICQVGTTLTCSGTHQGQALYI